MSLPEALERAATAMSQDADLIRPANGDPLRLLETLDAEAAVRVVTWLLSNDPEAADELASHWCEEPDGIAPLQEIDERELPKPGRKVLRRTLHRLRSRGVETGGRPRSEPVVARLPDLSDKIDAAYVCPLDPSGAYLVFIVEGHPSGGARLFQLLLDEMRGVVDFDVFEAGRSKLRGFLRKLCGPGGTAAVEADLAQVRALVGRIVDTHPQDRPLPRAFSEWRTKLITGAGEQDPGQATREALAGEPPAGAEERIVAGIASRVIGPWPPDSKVLAEVGEGLSGRLDEFAKLPEDARAAELDAALAGVVGEVFDSAYVECLARRFESQAAVFMGQKREEEARDCLAAAGSLRETPIDESSIARALVEVCFAPLIEKLTDQTSPGEAASDAQAEEAQEEA